MKETMQKEIKDTAQSWHLCLNYWKSNFTFLSKKGLLLTPPHPSQRKKQVRNIKLDFISVFVFTITAPQAVQGQISLVKKKLVRVLHLSLVGVFKINIIPPMGEKVKFIPRQAAVWQTKFLSVKISYWDFSIYSNKTKQKKRLQICIRFLQKTLNQEPWTWCEWN